MNKYFYTTGIGLYAHGQMKKFDDASERFLSKAKILGMHHGVASGFIKSLNPYSKQSVRVLDRFDWSKANIERMNAKVLS